MSHPTYFQTAYKLSGKVRWICHFLRITQILPLRDLRDQVNEKLARIETKRGEQEQRINTLIVENFLLGKISKRMQEKRLKPFEPKIPETSPSHAFRTANNDDYELNACRIYKEKRFRRFGRYPTILIPGFVPSGNEAFFLIKKCFLKFGSLYYLNYPPKSFVKETLFHQLYDTIAHINRRALSKGGMKRSPFLVGTSFGCRMILSFLRWLRENGLRESLDIKGLILISPVLCMEDIYDTGSERQRTLVGRAVAPLFDVDPNDPEAINKALAKGRSIFLKMFLSARDITNFAAKNNIPVFAIEDDVFSVFDEQVNSNLGYFFRYKGLQNEKPLPNEFLTDLPTLVLLAEGEKDVLLPNAPTLQTFSDIQSWQSIFPNGKVEVVYSKNPDRKVTHSDLIFQAGRFTDHLSPWLNQQTS